MILRHSHSTRRTRRSGFTLLEILLASILAGLLLAALYAALYTTLLQTQVTREAVESEDLSRGVFNKITNDLTGTLSPLPPKSGGNSAASGGQVATPAPTADPNAAAAPTTTTPATGGTGSNASAAAAPTTADPNATGTAAAEPGATDNATAVSADYAFQGGVVGEEGKLTIYAGRTPEAFGRYGVGDQVRSDQRQIIYWMEPGRGLYRRERPWVTADGVRNAIEADPDAPDSVLLAEEVTGAQFEYSDGSTWTSTWDGTTPGPDGVTPLGPPRAIKVTLDIKLPTSRGEAVTKPVSQIIVIRSAPGTYTPPLLEAPTDAASETAPADTSSGATGGTTGTGGASTGTGGTGGGMSTTTPAKTGGTSGATGGATGGATPTRTGGTTGGATPSSGTGGGRPSGSTGTGGGTGGGAGGRTGGTTGGTGGGR